LSGPDKLQVTIQPGQPTPKIELTSDQMDEDEIPDGTNATANLSKGTVSSESSVHDVIAPEVNPGDCVQNYAINDSVGSGSLHNSGHIAQPGFDGRGPSMSFLWVTMYINIFQFCIEILQGWIDRTDKGNEQHPPGLLDMESQHCGLSVLVQDISDANRHQQFPPPGIFGSSDLITVYLTAFRKANGEGSEVHYMIPRCHGDLSLSGGWYIYSQDLVTSIQSSPSHIHSETAL